MPEIGTSGSMSGEGKRSVGHRPQATAPFLDSTCAPKGAFHQWRRVPPRELSIVLVADERFGWATGRIEAS